MGTYTSDRLSRSVWRCWARLMRADNDETAYRWDLIRDALITRHRTLTYDLPYQPSERLMRRYTNVYREADREVGRYYDEGE